MTQLTKDVYSVIADYIPDIKTWYNYCLANKLIWSACKFKVKNTQRRFTYLDTRDVGGVYETFVRLRHNNKPHGEYKREMVDYNGLASKKKLVGLQETGYYNNGKKNGTFTKYNVSTGRKVWECGFKDDLKNGEEYVYDWVINTSDRPIALTTWYMGKKNGSHIEYNYFTASDEQVITCYELWEHGILLEKTRYKIVGVGKKSIIETMRLPDGKRQVYYADTSSLESQTTYLNGKMHGSHTEFSLDGTIVLSEMYENGKIVSRSVGTGPQFDNGVTDGWRLFYDSHGECYNKCLFKNGVMVQRSWVTK